MNTTELAQCQVQIAKWVAKRDRLIRAAHDEGMSLRAIADAAGLTHTAIAKICARGEGRSSPAREFAWKYGYSISEAADFLQRRPE